jgi:hypothetical protein
MTTRQRRNDSKAGKKRLKGRQEKFQRQARKDSQAGKKRLKGSQEKNQRQASNNDSKGATTRLTGRVEKD